MTRNTWYLACGWILVSVGALVLRVLVPPLAYFTSPHDDGLLVQHAASILDGDWLGSYNNRTLAKPAGYSIFLAIIHPTGLNPAIPTWGILLVGSTLIFLALVALRMRALSVLFVFASLMLNPALLGAEASRVYRDGFIASLATLGFGVAMTLGLQLAKSASGRRYLLQVAPLSLLAGLILGVIFVTKPDATYWLAPGMAMCVVATASFRLGTAHWFRRIIKAFGVACIAGVGLAIPFVAVSEKNHATYGYFGTEDFYSGASASMWSAWARVNGGSTRRFVPITQAQRESVYGISPTAAKLRPFLELPPDTGWRHLSCVGSGVCDESGGYFVWDVRDAFTLSGLSSTEEEFQTSQQQIARDIASACASRQLICSRFPAPFGLPPIDHIDPKDVAVNTFDSVRTSLGFSSAVPVSSFVTPSSPEEVSMWSVAVNGTNVKGTTASMLERIRVSAPIVDKLRIAYRLVAIVLFVPVAFVLLMLAVTRRRVGKVARIGVSSLAAFIIGALVLGVGGAAFLPVLPFVSLYTVPTSPMLVLSLALGLVLTCTWCKQMAATWRANSTREPN
jgi:hypothetical protein